ncbi:hypothetical protein VE02_04444 [Pseudogymnoascus sp. 03VT05]|nr:hypothetical protein VE02_04444 [Pseudogymnoascus sp. 03VT05]
MSRLGFISDNRDANTIRGPSPDPDPDLSMCLKTEAYYMECSHRFPQSFSHCTKIIEERTTKGWWPFSLMNADPYKECDDHRLEKKRTEGLCPTCDWEMKEKLKQVEEGRGG